MVISKNQLLIRDTQSIAISGHALNLLQKNKIIITKKITIKISSSIHPATFTTNTSTTIQK